MRKKRLSVCPWYTENWYDEDLEYALENAGIPLTDENMKKLKEACAGIFDDKSERNKKLENRAREIFRE